MYKLTFWVKCDGWKKGGYSNAHYFKNRKEADEWLSQPNIHAKELSFEKVRQIKEIIIERESFVICIDYNDKDFSAIIMVKKNKDGLNVVFDWQPLTKNNYDKACEIAKKLWLGEKV